ncbi:MAG: hypothetical protein KF824_06090 [Fimbriimonadaceae bacterium]|nr:MAG: hypothetical protein KF824_06090 [Fimbriimonadaceae bacterium]
MMKIYKTMLMGLFAAAVLGGTAIADLQAKPWKRQYLPDSTFSISIPGKLSQEGETEVEDKTDWVERTTDHVFETDDYYVQVTVFVGKKGTVANAAHLEKVAKDLVLGISESEESVKELSKKTIKIDGKSVITQAHEMGKDKNKIVFKSLLLGDANNVYAVLAVGYPSEPNSLTGIDKVMASVRYKAGLKD